MDAMNKITTDEVYRQEARSQELAAADIALYFRILDGAPVPAGCDVDALMDRVDLWERQRIFEISDRGAAWSWIALLVLCIWDAWRRKVGEALARGKGWRVVTTTFLSLHALAATALLIIRQVFFPLAPISLRPLRTVLVFTAV